MMDIISLENLLKILLVGGSLTAGAFFTALRAKLTNTKHKNWLHWFFYIASSIVIIGAIITLISKWADILPTFSKYPKQGAETDMYAIIVIFIAVIFSVALIWATKKFSVGKYQFTIKELNPIVNDFSKNADKGNIKLLAGNLDFFGKSASEIDKHPQYICLKEEEFRQIQILCTAPITTEDKLRYGKIVTDFPTVELRYYKPSNADLKVRGRIKTLNNVTWLLIYSKVIPGRYQAIPYNTAETDGAHYSHLWNLIWELADVPTQEQLNEYKKIYRP